MPTALLLSALLAASPAQPRPDATIWGNAATADDHADDPLAIYQTHLTLLAQGDQIEQADDNELCQPLNGLFGSPFTHRVYWENDGALHDPTTGYDRHYTNGFGITFEHQPEWADRFAAALPSLNIDCGRATTGVGYLFSQQIYTPGNLAATAPILTDQPYAGYLYGGVFLDRQAPSAINENVMVLDHVELNLGLIGNSSLAEDIQEWVHDNFQGDPINGWGNQRPDEFTVQTYLRRKWRFDTGEFALPLLGDVETQLIPQAGLALGTVYRYAETAATFRIGHNLPDDFGPGRLNDLQSTSGEVNEHPGWSWYAWTRLGGRAIEYNTFLDGSDFRSNTQSVNKHDFVGEIQVGAAAAYRRGNHRFEFTWGINYLTDQIDAPGGDGTESYGTWVLSYTYGF